MKKFPLCFLSVLILLLAGCNRFEPASDGVKTEKIDENEHPNILFISIDDLRNDLGALGADHMKTPHLDKFADEARLFSRHYVQVPTCGASRAALMRGRRADSLPFLSNNAIAETHQEWGDKSLPSWFRRHGYQTFSLGKITHYPGGLTGENWAEKPEELPGAWDRAWVPESPWKSPHDMMHGYANGKPRDRGESPPLESHEGSDLSYPDGWVANEAVKRLEELAGEDDPWFFAVGFFKPHLPFAAPQKYFDLYDPDRIPVPESSAKPSISPSSWHGSGEMMGNYGHGQDDPRNDESYARQLRHAYAAATSYVDAQVGRILNSFEDLGLGNNTIVVIWSDHGFALGEQGVWGKHSLYETALKSPLMIQYPGINHPGEISDAIVETVDLFPTLTGLSGLPAPEGLHGRNLTNQLENPGAPSGKPAISHYTGGQSSIRDENWRLIVHRPDEETEGIELFDFRENAAGKRQNPDDYPEVVEKLLKEVKR